MEIKKGRKRGYIWENKKTDMFCMVHKFENIPTIGNQFTWKKRGNSGMILKKLDRCIAKKDWIKELPNSYSKIGTFTCSDHAYVELNTETNKKGNTICFDSTVSGQE